MGFKEFTCDEDVWEIIDLLIQEVKDNNKKSNKDFDIAQSVNAQIPFFACKNVIFDKGLQDDIRRYVYCKDSGVHPYKGSYSEQPAIWIDKFFIIKNSFAKLEQAYVNKIKEKNA